MNFSREHHLAAMEGRTAPFDFIIVGGGATGLGAAVDAATRGHSVALVEMADFAKGTSSRSTKLVHGGVRYLRQGNVSLVLEALRERGRLAKNAPHLVQNRAFLVPNYVWWEGPFYGVGLKVYDALAGKLGIFYVLGNVIGPLFLRFEVEEGDDGFVVDVGSSGDRVSKREYKIFPGNEVRQ